MVPKPISTTTHGALIARQPILDRHRVVLGYELLCRPMRPGSAIDPTSATARVMLDALVGVGLDALVGDRQAFINLGHHFLIDDLATVLPPSRVVLELAADIEGDEDVIEACLRLKQAGFTIAIDD